MDKEEFEKQYCHESKITIEEYKRNYITLPCSCEWDGCNGWACVLNDEVSIRVHNCLYNRTQ